MVDKLTKLTPFDVGQVKAHMQHGLGCTKISRLVLRPDGSPFSETAIANCMNNLKLNPTWRGERDTGSGAVRKTTKQQDKQIIRWVLKMRGKKKVSVTSLKKQFPFLRKLGDSLVEERLHDADLEYLRRRSKSRVTDEYIEDRIAYCHSVKRKHQSTLEKWAYTDGTTYYLDRCEAEHDHTLRRALGTHVWRRSDNYDALFEDCLGPSSYSKGQGHAVRIWGVLACGGLNIHVLEDGEAMDTVLYRELIEDKFEAWCGNCEYLVCDFESCLRTDDAVTALEQLNITLVEGYPKCSQDFDAIENAWDILKKRLDVTVPVELESREEFVKRLKAAVLWVNQNRSDQLWYLSTNQKERATACLAQRPPGGRTKF